MKKLMKIWQEVEDEMLQRLSLMLVQPKCIVLEGCSAETTKKLSAVYPGAQLVAIQDALSQQKNMIDLMFVNNLRVPQAIETILTEANQVLIRDGLFMFAGFGGQTFQELHQENSVVPVSYDVQTYGNQLLQHGLIDPVLDVECIGLNYPDSKTLNADLALTVETSLQRVTVEIIYAHAFARGKKFSADQDGVVRIPLAQLKKSMDKT